MTRSGVGGYFDMPLSMALIDGEDDEAAVGNIELGVNFALDRSPFLFHVGLGLPTADGGFEERFANFAAIGARMNDVPLALAEAWWIRLGGSYADRASSVFWRVDAGVDVPFAEEEPLDYDPIFHIHGAFGVLIPSSALMVELTNFITEDAIINDDEVLNLLTLAWRFTGGPMRPSVGITLPLDDDVDSYMDFALVFSLEYLFPR